MRCFMAPLNHQSHTNSATVLGIHLGLTGSAGVLVVGVGQAGDVAGWRCTIAQHEIEVGHRDALRTQQSNFGIERNAQQVTGADRDS